MAALNPGNNNATRSPVNMVNAHHVVRLETAAAIIEAEDPKTVETAEKQRSVFSYLGLYSHLAKKAYVSVDNIVYVRSC